MPNGTRSERWKHPSLVLLWVRARPHNHVPNNHREETPREALGSLPVINRSCNSLILVSLSRHYCRPVIVAQRLLAMSFKGEPPQTVKRLADTNPYINDVYQRVPSLNSYSFGCVSKKSRVCFFRRLGRRISGTASARSTARHFCQLLFCYIGFGPNASDSEFLFIVCLFLP